ncbi:MAG TPA: hypothetical protein PLW74_02695 [Candidatus Dojkabacteria bacterium]|mgnify:CR=1 FL=1|nr:hypothetical protein [Candidatus Dojkabacteria bacterium]
MKKIKKLEQIVEVEFLQEIERNRDKINEIIDVLNSWVFEPTLTIPSQSQKQPEKQEEWERELRFTYGHLYYQNEEGEFCQIVNEIDDLIDFISQLLSEKEKEAKQEILRELSYEIDGIKLNKLIDENQEYLNKVGKSLLKQIKLLKDEENERHN